MFQLLYSQQEQFYVGSINLLCNFFNIYNYIHFYIPNSVVVCDNIETYNGQL
jgi:hypothetical protein